MIGRLATLLTASLLAASAGLTAQEPAQEKEEFVKIELRVSATGSGGLVTIDRGKTDGVAAGDRVTFRPRTGSVLRGRVLEVRERSATVEMDDPAFLPEPGTRGEVRIPATRSDLPPEQGGLIEPPPVDGPPTDPPPVTIGPEHPDWSNPDDEWTSDLPLLARVKAVRPEDRAMLYSGRLWLIADQYGFSEGGRSSSLFRAGSDLSVENPFGYGGEMEMDLEFDDFEFNVPDLDDDNESAARVDRLSYAIGGTRFAPDRFEVGRFLQHGMPQFGYLDGFEWTHRLNNGHRVGASVGYMPELDVDYDTGDDAQISGFYEWVVDGRTDLSVAAGAQKTWHDGTPDRDLFVTRFDYIPADGWDVRGATWLDSGPEITEALLSFGRSWESDGLVMTYRRLRFPDLENPLYLESLFDDVDNNHYDRLSMSGWHETAGDTRYRGAMGVWDDEDESGGDLELGVDTETDWLADSRSGFAVFATRGAFSVDVGARLSTGKAIEDGRWDISYEIADRHQDDFSHVSDDLWEHALRGSRAFYLPNGWYVSVDGVTRRFDDDMSWALSLYVHKTF